MKIIEHENGLYFWETVDGDSVTRSMPFTKTQTKTVMVDDVEQEICIYDDLIEQGYTLVPLSDEVKAQFEADNASQQLKLDNAAAKLAGVEIEGVMCSATAEDQHGLLAVARLIERAALSTVFKFENGNELLLSPDNINSFEAEWMPFRQSFFNQ